MKHFHFFQKMLSCGVALTLLFLWSTAPTFAQVIINEYMPAPTVGNEWIELRNMNNDELSLDGWTVEDSNGVLTPIPKFQNQVIPGKGLYVFELKNKLNNTGDQIIIKDPTGYVSDHVIYQSSSPTESWSFNDELHMFQLTVPTKGVENLFILPSPELSPTPTPSATPIASASPSPSLTPSPSPQPSPSPVLPSTSPIILPTPIPIPSPSPAPLSKPLQLSEVVACPASGEPEWLELYNPNSYQITLTSWKLKDRTGNTKTFTIDLPAESYQLIEITSSLLNNDGDSVAILDLSGTQVTAIDLPSCSSGQSLVYTQNNWQLTTTPTPLASNVFTAAITASPSPTSYAVGFQSTTAVGTTGSNLVNPSPSAELTSSLSEQELSKLLTDGSLSLDENVSDEEPQESLHSLPLLQAFTSSSSASTDSDTAEKGQVLGTTTETTAPPKKIIPRWPLALLLLASVSCLAFGGYSFYQWYTEHRAKIDLETL